MAEKSSTEIFSMHGCNAWIVVAVVFAKLQCLADKLSYFDSCLTTSTHFGR